MKKFIRNFLLTSACLLISGSGTALNAMAAEKNEVSGIEVSISSDKDEYAVNDSISINYSVRNKSAADIEGAAIKMTVPEGLKLKDGSTAEQTISVGAGETFNGSAVLLKNDVSGGTLTTSITTTTTTSSSTTSKSKTDSAKTGDFTNIFIPMSVLMVAAVLAFLSRKKSKNSIRFLSLLLCLSVITSAVPLDANAAEKTGVNIGVDKSIKVGSTAYKIELSFSADVEKGLTVTIDQKDNMIKRDGFDGFIVADKLNALSGTVSGSENDIKSVTVSVISGKKTLTQNEVTFENGIWTLKEPQLIIGDNEITVKAVTDNDETASASLHIWNTSYDNSNLLSLDMKDSDEDGLLNYQEEQYGTDPDKKDTDGDSFSDIDELFVLKTDPLKANADEDFDTDGLSNLNELKNNTDPFRADTDNDGLNDNDELNVHKTDPKLADTDKDGINDFLEIKYGTDPLNPEKVDENGKIKVAYTPDKTGKDVNASIEISLSPEQLASFKMNDIKSDDPVISGEIPGYIGEGSAYDFSLDGQFSDAKLSFVIPDEYLNDPDFVPGIYYYNEETGLLEELENVTVEGNTVSVQLEHFSTYILLNKTEYETVWVYDLLFVEDSKSSSDLDVVFVIDSSGSMITNDRNGVRKTVTKEFISKLLENDQAAVVDFDSSAKLNSGFKKDKEALNLAVDKIDSSGGTNLGVGISTALNLFSNPDYTDNGNLKCIVMLTDGQGSYNEKYTKQAAEMGVKIYTIGLGNSVSKTVLTKMAEDTGGQYFPASEANKLYDIFSRIYDLTDLYKDFDKDGISDYHEKAMAAGLLRLGTGVKLEKMDYQNPDSDGDNIKDGDELQIVKGSTQQYGTKIYAYMYSNPTEDDTDYDGIGDEVERNGVPTSIGTYTLNPLKLDTDGDWLSDGYELGTMTSYGYYRVNSNPFVNEDFNLGNQGAVSYFFASKIKFPSYVNIYNTGTLADGRAYTIYTFVDTSLPSVSDVLANSASGIRKLLEVENGSNKEYYLLFAATGNKVRGGQFDEIYRKATLFYDVTIHDYSLMTGNNIAMIGLNSKWHETWKFYDSDPAQFMYYSNSRSKVLSEDEWKIMNYDTRYELNCDHDKYLPINALEAQKMGFDKLPESQAVYHMPEGKDETDKGGSLKYIRTDGLEAIYEVLNGSDDVEKIIADPNSNKLMTLQENTAYGPTFNYAPNDDDLTSNASIAHYYFDMLPYFWWGTVRS